MNTVTHKSTLIIIRLEFIPLRQLLSYLVRLAFHVFCKIDQIHARLFHQINEYSIFSIGIYLQEFLLFLNLHLGNIRQSDRANAVITYNYIPQFFHIVDTRISQSQIQTVIVSHITVTQHKVRLRKSRLYLCRSDTKSCHLRGIGFYNKLLRLTTSYHDITNAVHLREHRTNYQVSHITQGYPAVCLTLQREAIDRKQRLVHRFG